MVMTGAIANQETKKKEKRGVGFESFQSSALDPLNVPQSFGLPIWNPVTIDSSVWDSDPTRNFAFENVQFAAPHNSLTLQALRDPGSVVQSVAYSPEVLRAIQFAKEANRHVQLAQQRVHEAKQAAIIQQKIALARETAAREAAQRSAEIVSQADAEARMSAQQLVDVQRRLATLKDAVAAAQRLAAARENAAAAAIQRSAADTAAELRKQDVERQISQTEREAKGINIAFNITYLRNIFLRFLTNLPIWVSRLTNDQDQKQDFNSKRAIRSGGWEGGQIAIEIGGWNQHQSHAIHAVPVGEHVQVSKPLLIPIYKNIGVPLVQPVGIPVPHITAIAAPQPYPVHVPVLQPVAIPVIKTVATIVEKKVPYPIEKIIHVPIEKPIPIHIEKKIPVNSNQILNRLGQVNRFENLNDALSNPYDYYDDSTNSDDQNIESDLRNQGQQQQHKHTATANESSDVDDNSDDNSDYDYDHQNNGISQQQYLVQSEPVSQHVEVMQPIAVPVFKEIGVPVPQPVKIDVPHPIAVGVPQPYPVAVPVPHPVPIQIIKTIAVPVEKKVPYPIEKQVPVPIEKPVPILVPLLLGICQAMRWDVHQNNGGYSVNEYPLDHNSLEQDVQGQGYGLDSTGAKKAINGLEAWLADVYIGKNPGSHIKPIIKEIGYPVYKKVELKIPYPDIQQVSQPYPILMPMLHPVRYEVVKTVVKTVERKVPTPMEKVVPVPVEKPVPFEVVKHVPVFVEKKIPIKIPVYKTIHHKIYTS
ncbi:hypothetical protein QAD02_008689 [Eretmocerus hayati]|uniref:Uncharacterized protein n=1 Tax=Eretmocerus hayati TaxID=131215 RepID=A0ACC2N7J1_9HYME|nr:hypothetical protein QAD02_008689 [Eretmocerus hayati]